MEKPNEMEKAGILKQIIGLLVLVLLIVLVLAMPSYAIADGKGPTIPLECGTFNGEQICKLDSNFTFEGAAAPLDNNWTAFAADIINTDGKGNALLNNNNAILQHRLFNRSQTNNWSIQYDFKSISSNANHQTGDLSNLNFSVTQSRIMGTYFDNAGTIGARVGGNNYCGGLYGSIEGDGISHQFQVSFLQNNSVRVWKDNLNFDSEACDFNEVNADLFEVVFWAIGIDQDSLINAEYDNVTFFNGTSYPTFGGGGGGGAAGPNLTITAADAYDSSALTNFSVEIKGSTNWTQTTLNGTILIVNTTTVFYNLTIFSKANGSYHNVTYENINLSGQNFKGNLTQSFLSLNVTDLLTNQLVSSFTVKTNFSTYDVTGGYILLPSKAGFHKFNVSSTAYPILSFTYTISALENLTFQANVSPRFQFYLRREADNSVFNVAGTNTTKLTIFCPTKNIVIQFKNNTPESRNSTQENITIDCPYTLMKMDISYPDSSYFRSLIPSTSQQNVTWWLLDLNVDTGVQKILELIDLTGEWSSGKIRMKTNIDQNNEIITEQNFDISNSVTMYLLKDGLYTVTLINNLGTQERQLGTIIADSAGTITITYPNIPFYPENTLFEDNISWSYTCPFSQCLPPYNTSDSILRLRYVDTINGTNSITWGIYNGTNTTKLLQEFTSTLHDVTFTYQPTVKNMTYYTKLFVQNTILDFNITDNRVFGDFELPVLPGFTKDEQQQWAFYLSGIFLVVWGLGFSAYHAGIGLASTFIFALLFRLFGWFPIHVIWLALIGFAAIVTFTYESIKKD